MNEQMNRNAAVAEVKTARSRRQRKPITVTLTNEIPAGKMETVLARIYAERYKGSLQ